jgi:ribosome-associated toxin RatA of RatAB toxin-antitoxin module
MSSRLPLHSVVIASATLLAACTIQRAPQMSRPATDDRAPASAKPAAAPAEPPDEPIVGSVPVAGSDIVGTNATVLVRAPVARLRDVLYDCARYPEFLSSYKSCTDLGPGAHGGRVVRMEMEELGGMIKLWLKVEITKLDGPDGVEVHEQRLLDGNIKSYHSIWRLAPVERGFTRLTIESHLDPKLPLPAALINGGSVDGIRQAILAIKQRAEKGSDEVGAAGK